MEVCPRDFQLLLEQLLDRGVYARFTARGGSMAPVILHDEIVTVAPIGAGPIRPGEIVLVASRTEGLLIHRVVEVTGEGPAMRFITKGDAARVADRPVGREEILGRVTRVEKIGAASSRPAPE
jgi:signal peptidase I